MAFFDRLKEGLSKSRERLNESLNVLFDVSPGLTADFWDDLEETLILADMGGPSSLKIVSELQNETNKKGLSGISQVKEMLAEQIAAIFTPVELDPFDQARACILFVGINGAGKTTTVGKLAKEGVDSGKKVLIGSADTFRAAAIEQLDVWGERAGVEIVKRERGADPASVCYDTLDRAQELGSELVLIDTAGRLHTSSDLMRELAKVVNVTRKHAPDDMPVYVVLVMDATTGQNGLAQAKEFNEALELDGLIVTKLDGTAKGGIAVAVSHEIELPIYRMGVGESIEDLKPFKPIEYAWALIGDKKGH
ncbi:MAG: signal recognition particle-docking protein FtsY [Coriobacteriia bacterium]|nr:signal recognition particle-docking protein FtsY [Coriobacteriia bacterium]